MANTTTFLAAGRQVLHFFDHAYTEREIDVRFAISAVAAVSGLFLLALAFYGQPAVYLQEARDQWDELMDRPVAHGPLFR